MRLLILHGLIGNDPEHWQTWLARTAQQEGLQVDYPDLPDPDAPTLPAWADVVRPLVRPPAQTLLVAVHSLSVHLWAHLAATSPGPLARRVVLVAPPGVPEVAAEIPTFAPVELDPPALLRACADTVLVLGQDDPWLADPQPMLASGLPVHWVPGGEHLNVASGHGAWPEMLAWLHGGSAPGEPATRS